MSDERFANMFFFIACIGLLVKLLNGSKLLVLRQPGKQRSPEFVIYGPIPVFFSQKDPALFATCSAPFARVCISKVIN